MTQDIQTVPAATTVIEVALNRLKASPRNARRTPHAEADIEALAASIAAKGVLQAPVVEPEIDGEGTPTGAYLVTIGEGRRKALCLLARNKVIRKTHPVRCVVDLANDPHEISLDENVTRSAMHPADQFEAFRRLSEERGLSAEEIAARFGVSAHMVRQRLRLGAVSPALMELYRTGELTLDQMTAFAVSEDHERQAQVLEQLGAHRPAYLIRRAMTEAKVFAQDRRAMFIGQEAYGEAGGPILRDLFTEDGGGWFEDVALLDRLVADKLAAIAGEVRTQEGWKWAEAHIDYPRAEGLARVWPRKVERSEAEAARIAELSDAYDAIVSQYDGADEWPAEVEANLAAIEADLEAFGEDYAYDPDEIARGGVFVILGQDGVARIERGFVRHEDVPAPAPAPEAAEGGEAPAAADPQAASEAEENPRAPLSDRLVQDLTAHRTMALREALGGDPATALAAVVHALALASFYPPYERPSCLEIRATSTSLAGPAPGIEDTEAGRAVAGRHEAWASRLPREADDLWAFVVGLSSDEQLALLAHCASLTVNAVRIAWDRRVGAWAHADGLAQALSLDMATRWTPTVGSYLGRVSKGQIAEAVSEAVSPEAAARIGSLKKADMAAEAEALLAGTGWLPRLLRPPVPAPEPSQVVTPLSQDAA